MLIYVVICMNTYLRDKDLHHVVNLSWFCGYRLINTTEVMELVWREEK